MTALMDSFTPSMPGSFLADHDQSAAGRMTYSGCLKSLQQSPNPFSGSPSSSVPQPYYTTQSRSIPRAGANSAKKRPRLAVYQPGSSGTTNRPDTNLETPRTFTNSSYVNIDSASDWARSPSHDARLNSSTHSFGLFSELGSPSPLANSSYRLAGGLDTPSASFERSLEQSEEREAEKDWRVNRYNKSAILKHDQPHTPRLGSGIYQGRKRLHETTAGPGDLTQSSTWGLRSTAWALTGGLAGRVFNFCWNSAFRGFSAGGGQTYNLDMGTSEVSTEGIVKNVTMQRLGGQEDVFSQQYLISAHGNGGDVPGEFPQTAFVDDYMTRPFATSRRNTSNTRTPTLSKLNSTNAGSTIRRDWTFIDQADMDTDDSTSPARKRPRASIAGSPSHTDNERHRRPHVHDRRPSNGPSHSGVEGHSGASYASPRSRNGASTSTSSYAYTSQNLTGPYCASRSRSASYTKRPSSSTSKSSPQRRQSNLYLRPQDLASGRSSPTKVAAPGRSSIAGQSGGNMSPEIVTYQKQKRREQRRHDETMSRLNSQLRDMIREGKEALGSKIEVDILDDSSSDDDDIPHDQGFFKDIRPLKESREYFT